jgi:hypothetical protein
MPSEETAVRSQSERPVFVRITLRLYSPEITINHTAEEFAKNQSEQSGFRGAFIAHL